MNGLRKYAAVFHIGIKNELAYRFQVLLNTLFLLIILYVFVELWSSAFQSHGTTRIAGYTSHAVIWYLVMTESIILGTPRLVAVISQEIKEGDIAYRLTKPLSYLGYHYCTYLSQAGVRITINLAVGAMLALIAAGPPALTLLQIALVSVLIWSSVTLSFCLYGCIALLALWIEDARGMELVMSRFVMILGGMMIPLTMFPQPVARICLLLPFQVIAYGPAHVFAAYSSEVVRSEVAITGTWLLVMVSSLVVLYRKGVQKLHVQGG